jgi:uncharacterized protein
LAADIISGQALRWTFVLYLTALDLLLIFRPPSKPATTASDEGKTKAIGPVALLTVGAIAGFASGLMGIGGGLAITAGLSGGLKVPQHQAQAVSLVLSVIPLTIPAAWIYWQHGWSLPWPVVAGVILGLWGGTDLGARMAGRLGETALRRILVGMVSAMAAYMAYKAIS